MTEASSQPSPPGAPDARPGFVDGANPGAVSADTAHELANLMMVVSGSLEQLRRQPLDEQGQRQLARAEWSARQAARLTRQVLFQARGAEGAPPVVDLNAVTGGFAAIIGQDVSQGVQLSANLAPGPLPVRVDAGLLELVLLNLVRNAADAMAQPSPGGGTREAGASLSGGKVVLQTIGPRLDGLGNQLAVEVAVSDTGTGMAPDLAGRAADAFFTTKPPGKGTGLGLWMAHRFASAHGGKISIETAPGRGTTVRLSLPYAGDAEPS